MDPTVRAVLGVCMRWIHIASVVTLIGGFIFARFVFAPAAAAGAPGERNSLTAAAQSAFRPLLYLAIAAALISGAYNYATKTSYPPGYHMWMGIKLLFVLHIIAASILDSVRAQNPEKSSRTALGIVITGLIAIGIAGYLRFFVFEVNMTGYEALRTRAAWLDLSARGKIKLTGEDRARLLHAMTTNHIQQLTPGTGCYAFFLNDKGRVLADANILCREDYFLLDVEPESREPLYQHLDRFIIADDVTLEDMTDSTATVAVEGPRAANVLQSLGATVPEAEYASLAWESFLIARLSFTGEEGHRIFGPAAEKAALISRLEAAGAEAADADAARIVRLEHGKPRYSEDISDRFLAQEANRPHALHFSKGCYLGQEIVERVRSRGQIHRVLMPLTLETKEPPAPGTKLQMGDASAAEITSSAYSPALNKVVALAYVRTDHARPHEKLMLGGVDAEVGLPAA